MLVWLRCIFYVHGGVCISAVFIQVRPEMVPYNSWGQIRYIKVHGVWVLQVTSKSYFFSELQHKKLSILNDTVQDLKHSTCYAQKSIFHRVSRSPPTVGAWTTPGGLPDSVSHSVHILRHSFVNNLNVYLFNSGQVLTETEIMELFLFGWDAIMSSWDWHAHCSNCNLEN